MKGNTVEAEITVRFGDVEVEIDSTGVRIRDTEDQNNSVHIGSQQIDNLLNALKDATERYESAVEP